MASTGKGSVKEGEGGNSSSYDLYKQFTLEMLFKSEDFFSRRNEHEIPLHFCFYLLHFSRSMLLTTVIVCLCAYLSTSKKIETTNNEPRLHKMCGEKRMQVGLNIMSSQSIFHIVVKKSLRLMMNIYWLGHNVINFKVMLSNY